MHSSGSETKTYYASSDWFEFFEAEVTTTKPAKYFQGKNYENWKEKRKVFNLIMSDAYLIPDLLQLLVINDTDCVLKDLFISNNYLEKVIFEIDDNVSYRSNFRPLCKQIVQCFTGFGFQKKKTK